MEKACKECKEILPLDSFTKSKNVKDGYENKCKKCRNEARRKYRVICASCGLEFRTARKETKYCSHNCMGKPRSKRVIKKCSWCNSEVSVKRYKIGQHEHYYCNQDCRSEHLKLLMLGENNPNYTSEVRPCDGCGQMIKVNPFRRDNYNFCTYECYQENIGQYFSGENNWNYNPDLTEEERIVGRNYPKYEEWRTAVFQRDDFTCQSCFDDTGGNLIGHHILNYTANPDLRTEVDNGITLCKDCHIEFHNTFGYTKNTHKQLNLFLSKQASY